VIYRERKNKKKGDLKSRSIKKALAESEDIIIFEE